MNSPTGWLLPGVAIASAALAVWAGTDLAVALPATGLAVLAAALVFVGAWLEDRTREVGRAPPHAPRFASRLRVALRSGPLGREELMTTLDRVERAGPAPGLPPRTLSEMEALVRLPRPEFERYLRRRLDDLEERL